MSVEWTGRERYSMAIPPDVAGAWPRSDAEQHVKSPAGSLTYRSGMWGCAVTVAVWLIKSRSKSEGGKEPSTEDYYSSLPALGQK